MNFAALWARNSGRATPSLRCTPKAPTKETRQKATYLQREVVQTTGASSQPSVLGLPVVQRSFRNPVLPGQVRCLRTQLVFLQDRDNLLFRKPRTLHRSVLPSGRTLTLRGGKSQWHVRRYAWTRLAPCPHLHRRSSSKRLSQWNGFWQHDRQLEYTLTFAGKLYLKTIHFAGSRSRRNLRY